MICEQLGCTPSELYEKHPGMTEGDKWFMISYGYEKIAKEQMALAEIIKKMFGGK
jgi:hypothetical protein